MQCLLHRSPQLQHNTSSTLISFITAPKVSKFWFHKCIIHEYLLRFCSVLTVHLSSTGYYVPNDDGEFYQFCYVTHKGEIRGASTPFQFRASSPSEDELLTVEDECNSDILVVTTKAGFLEVWCFSADLLNTSPSTLTLSCECAWTSSTIYVFAAKSGRSRERKGRAGQKHGRPAAGEGAAGGWEGESAEAVRAGEGDVCPAEKREPSKQKVMFDGFLKPADHNVFVFQFSNTCWNNPFIWLMLIFSFLVFHVAKQSLSTP